MLRINCIAQEEVECSGTKEARGSTKCKISYVRCSSSQRNYQPFVIVGKFRDREGAKCAPSIPSRMGLQRKVVISLEESFQRILPGNIDMELILEHESSHLDEQREEVREALVDVFE